MKYNKTVVFCTVINSLSPMLRNAILISMISYVYVQRDNLVPYDIIYLIMLVGVLFLFSMISEKVKLIQINQYKREKVGKVKPKEKHTTMARFNVHHNLIASRAILTISLIVLIALSFFTLQYPIASFIFIFICYKVQTMGADSFVQSVIMNIAFIFYFTVLLVEILYMLNTSIFLNILLLISARLYLSQLISHRNIMQKVKKLQIEI